jgi:hypothetical protein
MPKYENVSNEVLREEAISNTPDLKALANSIKELRCANMIDARQKAEKAFTCLLNVLINQQIRIERLEAKNEQINLQD